MSDESPEYESVRRVRTAGKTFHLASRVGGAGALCAFAAVGMAFTRWAAWLWVPAILAITLMAWWAKLMTTGNRQMWEL